MIGHEKRVLLLVQLINGLIDQRARLELEAVALPRRVNWKAKVDINDTGKLIGKKAAHLFSLRVLIALMGKRFSEEWRLTVLDPDEGERLPSPPPPRPREFNPSLAQDFLGQVLDAMLDENPLIIVERGPGALEFAFVIHCKSVSDYERLVTAIGVGREELTPVAALGTLFRAYGHQQGVAFRIEVPPQ